MRPAPGAVSNNSPQTAGGSGLDRQQVTGRTITSVGYDPATAVLQIEFVGGDVYSYFLVPASVHRALMGSPSKGRFFGEHVRDRFQFERW